MLIEFAGWRNELFEFRNEADHVRPRRSMVIDPQR